MEAIDAGEALAEQLSQWTKNIELLLLEAMKNDPPDLPAALSPGQQSMAEPLLYIADAAGGSWPAKARAAVTAVFSLAQSSPELQILADIRDIFDQKKNPEYLATSDLLNELSNMDHRPWSTWSSTSGLRLANHLRPFDISSGRVHPTAGTDFKAYFVEDFIDAWDRYLPSSSAPVAPGLSDVSSERNSELGAAKLPSLPWSSPQISAVDAG